jgi:hypothetical protein
VHLCGCLMFIVGKLPDNVQSPEGDYWIKHYRIPPTVMDSVLPRGIVRRHRLLAEDARAEAPH